MLDKGCIGVGLAAFVVGLAVGLGVGDWHGRKEASTAEAAYVVTARVDTIRDTIPTYIRETHVQTVERVLRVVDTLRMVRTDTLRTRDSVLVEVPITQRVYRADSLYTAWVSGYEAQLDSIEITRQTVVQSPKSTRPHWGLSVYGGCGTDFSHGVKPQVGIGVSYVLFLF